MVTCNHKSHGEKIVSEKYLHLHHAFPKYLGGTDLDERIYLCNSHHKEIHQLIKLLGYTNKEEIIEFTHLWIENKKNKVYCPICKNSERTLSIWEIHWKSLILGCVYCGHTEENTSLFPDYINQQLKEDEENDSLF